MLFYHVQYLLIKDPFTLIWDISKDWTGSLEKFSTLPPPLRRRVHSHSASASSCSLSRPQSFPISYPRNTISGLLMSENGTVQFLTKVLSHFTISMNNEHCFNLPLFTPNTMLISIPETMRPSFRDINLWRININPLSRVFHSTLCWTINKIFFHLYT